MMGFSKDVARRIFQAWAVPEYITVVAEIAAPLDPLANKGMWKARGLHCFLYFLHRMYCGTQPSHDKQEFCYSYSALSSIFTAFCRWMDITHSFRLTNIPIDRAAEFNAAIVAKIETLFPGEVMPPDLRHVFLFTDGNRRRISRPAGEFWVQYAYFSGDKWFCNVGSQGTTGPDGMFYDWFMGPVGRRADQHFFNESHLNTRLQDLQLGNPIQYWTYTDKGFVAMSHCRSAIRGGGLMQRYFDVMMSSGRVTVEWGFGKIKQRCRLLDDVLYLRVFSVNIERITRCAVLLTNTHTCIENLGSNSSCYFNIAAPILEDYFQ